MEHYAVPAMLEQGWAFKAAKSYAWKQARRGPEYHIDQPLRTHIMSGAYALTRLLEYLQEKGYYQMYHLNNSGHSRREIIRSWKRRICPLVWYAQMSRDGEGSVPKHARKEADV